MARRTENKRERQRAERAQGNQLRRSQPSLERAGERMPQKEHLLIVSEGANTEPSYFKQFRYPTAKIETISIVGEGYNTLSLVSRAEELKNTPKYNDYEVWCVFDADPKPDNPKQLQNFNNAIKKAEALGYSVAYSNQAFEYWLILHFEDHQGIAMHRDLYWDKINKHLRSISKRIIIYDRDSKTITEDIFNILLGIDAKTKKSRQNLAIERAERIYMRDDYDHGNPATEESSTTVFKLVRKLSEHHL